MEVEIWSDIVCPFCYIGKRRFEEALAAFAHADDVQITWKSFQLQPDLVTDPTININQHLADTKGWQLDHAKQLNRQVTEMAESVGLQYQMDNVVVANSFDAHRLAHLAAAMGLSNEVEEALFNAYFIQGKNIADQFTLKELGAKVGLNTDNIETMLNSGTYTDAVKADIEEARELGISGVPFFVLNGKYAISGAQSTEVFSGTLEKAWADI